jgi:hypothetical protein
MTRCTVRDNHATDANLSDGGGIYAGGSTTLTDCLVEDNRAARDGGGLFVIYPGAVTLAGSTQVHDNAANFGGGIHIESGTLTIAETCRVTENTASAAGNGGGIYNSGGMVTLQGADPSPIVVNNCHENCAPLDSVAKCAATPVSC